MLKFMSSTEACAIDDERVFLMTFNTGKRKCSILDSCPIPMLTVFFRALVSRFTRAPLAPFCCFRFSVISVKLAELREDDDDVCV